MKTHKVQDALRTAKHPYTWPGGYPIYNITDDGEYLCPECVLSEWYQIAPSTRNNVSDGWNIVGQDINYEDNDAYCCHCSKKIESAYGDDE